jgi:thioredoxin 1
MVKFGASWCSPCVAMEPVLESVSEKYPDRVADVDIMSNKELTERFGIRNIPATIFFKNGEEVNRKSGIIEFKTIESKPSMGINSLEINKNI